MLHCRCANINDLLLLNVTLLTKLIQSSIHFDDLAASTNKGGVIDDGVESVTNPSSYLASPSTSRAVVFQDKVGVCDTSTKTLEEAKDMLRKSNCPGNFLFPFVTFIFAVIVVSVSFILFSRLRSMVVVDLNEILSFTYARALYDYVCKSLRAVLNLTSNLPSPSKQRTNLSSPPKRICCTKYIALLYTLLLTMCCFVIADDVGEVNELSRKHLRSHVSRTLLDDQIAVQEVTMDVDLERELGDSDLFEEDDLSEEEVQAAKFVKEFNDRMMRSEGHYESLGTSDGMPVFHYKPSKKRLEEEQKLNSDVMRGFSSVRAERIKFKQMKSDSMERKNARMSSMQTTRHLFDKSFTVFDDPVFRRKLSVTVLDCVMDGDGYDEICETGINAISDISASIDLILDQVGSVRDVIEQVNEAADFFASMQFLSSKTVPLFTCFLVHMSQQSISFSFSKLIY